MKKHTAQNMAQKNDDKQKFDGTYLCGRAGGSRGHYTTFGWRCWSFWDDPGRRA